VGLDSNFGCGVNGQYWVVNGDPKIIGTFGPGGQWFATTNPDGTPIFTKPTPGTFNTQRVRNLIYQPGYQNWNLGLFKDSALVSRKVCNSVLRRSISSTIPIGVAEADAAEQRISDLTQ